MLTRTQHLFDEATAVTAGDSRWRGQTSDDYWAFVGPFGGATAATILRALIDHPQRSGDPLALTVNFCAPIAQGDDVFVVLPATLPEQELERRFADADAAVAAVQNALTEANREPFTG